jgi:superfamily II DNA/RNA helicase
MNRPNKPSSSATSRPSSGSSARPGAGFGSRSAADVAARRGDSTRAANAKRRERNGTSTPSGRPSNPRPPKIDMFAAFDEGDTPNPDATFAELGVPAPLIKALLDGGIDKPFPIQAATMADCMAGRDVLGRGRTGSGKTLAFVLPVLTRLAASNKQRRQGRPRALILVPTRELAMQIDAALSPLGKLLGLRSTTIFGGVGAQPQINALRQGVDIVIACPGRLDDHIGGNFCRLDDVEITVLDEADHMADMGFLPGVTKLLAQTPQHSQRLLFSATLDNGIDVIVNKFLHNPVLRSVDPAEAAEVKMTHHVLHVTADERFPVLRDMAAAPGRIMIFTRTKHGAKKLAKTLSMSGVPAVEMHGNLSQNNRTRNLAQFSDGSATAMVATDIAARGIHVDDVALVVHFDPPVDHKVYVHRSGRTARAGAEGTVVTMMTDDQQAEIRDLTKKAGISPTITRVTHQHPLLAEIAPGEREFRAALPVESPNTGLAARGKGQNQSARDGAQNNGGRGQNRGQRGEVPGSAAAPGRVQSGGYGRDGSTASPRGGNGAARPDRSERAERGVGRSAERSDRGPADRAPADRGPTDRGSAPRVDRADRMDRADRPEPRPSRVNADGSAPTVAPGRGGPSRGNGPRGGNGGASGAGRSDAGRPEPRRAVAGDNAPMFRGADRKVDDRFGNVKISGERPDAGPRTGKWARANERAGDTGRPTSRPAR